MAHRPRIAPASPVRLRDVGGHVLRPVSTGDLDKLEGVLGRAFGDDPLMMFIFDGRPDQLHRIGRLFRMFVAIHLRHEGCSTTADVAGASLWAPPGRWRLGWMTQIRMAPRLLPLLGAAAVKHLGDFNRMEQFHQSMPPEHWHLAVLGTDPSRQGEGVGSALLQPVLDRCDAEGSGAYLESSKRSNLAFYSRFGFEVVDERSFTDGPSYWPMWRDPRQV